MHAHMHTYRERQTFRQTDRHSSLWMVYDKISHIQYENVHDLLSSHCKCVKFVQLT